MDELYLIISYSNLRIVSGKLQEWRLKIDNEEKKQLLKGLESRLSESEAYFRGLEKELRVSIQLNSESRLNTLKLSQEIEELKKENQELKDML